MPQHRATRAPPMIRIRRCVLRRATFYRSAVVKFRLMMIGEQAGWKSAPFTGGCVGRGTKSRTTFYPCRGRRGVLEHPMLHALRANAVGSPRRSDPIYFSVPRKRITRSRQRSLRPVAAFPSVRLAEWVSYSVGLLPANRLGGRRVGVRGREPGGPAGSPPPRKRQQASSTESSDL